MHRLIVRAEFQQAVITLYVISGVVEGSIIPLKG